MNFDTYIKSFSESEPPAECSPCLKALWYDAKDQWENSHNIAQEILDKNGSWIHAYLHRKEGDTANADYWYHKAGKAMPGYSLEREWQEIVKSFF